MKSWNKPLLLDLELLWTSWSLLSFYWGTYLYWLLSSHALNPSVWEMSRRHRHYLIFLQLFILLFGRALKVLSVLFELIMLGIQFYYWRKVIHFGDCSIVLIRMQIWLGGCIPLKRHLGPDLFKNLFLLVHILLNILRHRISLCPIYSILFI